MTRFLFALLLVAVLWIALGFHDTPPGETDIVDDALRVFICLVFVVAATVMLISRREWSARAMGLFLTSVASAAVYGGSFYADHMVLDRTCLTLEGGQVTCFPGGIPEPWLDFIRALFVVGGTLLAYGLTVWIMEFVRTFRRLPRGTEIERDWHAPVALATVDGDLPAWGHRGSPDLVRGTDE